MIETPDDRAALSPTDGADPIRNVLFIMCDQLRADALSCYGGSLIDTPHIDRLATRGVRFDRAYVQGAVCGSSRMSFYTGRYVQSHGARHNRIPLSIGQRTLGDQLRPLGVRPVLIGKTHMAADREGLDALGLSPDAPEAMYLAECGFEPEARHDGLYPLARARRGLAYNDFLNEHGFEGVNPWHSAANSVIDADGRHTSGWLLRASPFPAIVPDELSETAYMTDRAIEFIREAGDDRWCVHLSFIKPHWPYVVSDPYHALVDPSDVLPAHRHDTERIDEHPVLRAFRDDRTGLAFADDAARRAVYPAYLGLVKQIDDHLGRLFAELDRLGRADDTMIVFTSDHGDYLGDHWMGDKDWVHEEIVRVPMIVADPRPSADATRGTVSQAIIEAIDLAPTFVEALGGDPTSGSARRWLEGSSLTPLLAGDASAQRSDDHEVAICEADYGYLELADAVGPVPLTKQRATMLCTDRYKYVLSETGPNLLYDLVDDPDEFVDRSGDPALAAVQSELHDRLFEWFRERTNEVTEDEPIYDQRRVPGDYARGGIFIGYWDEAAAAAENATDHLEV